MAVVLPVPVPPAALPVPAAWQRAHRRWQAAQGHAQREEWQLAADAFEQATALDRDDAFALAAAHALIKAGRADAAVRRARGIRTANPRAALAYTLESHALLALGRAADAVDCLGAVPADVARDNDHCVSFAVALQRCGRHPEAIGAFFEALALKMDDPVSHFRLGMSFKDIGMKAEAAECVRTAIVLGLGTSDLAARGQLAFLEREACRWAEADAVLAALRAAVQALPHDVAVETGAFPHAVLVDDPHEQLKVARHYALHVQRSVRPLPRQRARTGAGRLRIGYLSADFHQHATSQLLVEALEQHDRGGFEVTLFSTGPDDGSALRRRIVASTERFEELRGASVEAIAQRVRALGIDILVDLKGATHDTLLPVLAQRPAPLQATWLGFPGTTGAPFIDYVIGDPVVTPLDAAAAFAEKIAQLPHCYQPNDSRRARPAASGRAEWGVPADALLLCAFHQSYKISAEVFDAWCALLQARPDAVLWLLRWNTNVEATLTAAAAARGIGADRLVFAPVLPLAQHLSRLACADVYLDAWPCNAHTTAGEALWCGVPVVTIRGRTFAQRVAPSLLHAVGLDALVADDVAGYVERVADLAADPAQRAALKMHLEIERADGTLFAGTRFARELEALYRRMWARAVDGQPPAALPARQLPDVDAADPGIAGRDAT